MILLHPRRLLSHDLYDYMLSKKYAAKCSHNLVARGFLEKDEAFMIKRPRLALPIVFILGLVVTTGCASNPSRAPTPNPSAAAGTRGQMQGAASEAASQPLRDIGLMKKRIPFALSRIADPYAEPSGPGCVWISYELTQLSAALGDEVAVMPGADNSTTSEKGSRMAIEAARDIIRSSGSSILPGRSVIRRLSGASNADELYRAAKERGMVRRGYLKGISDARNCSA
jgi:hypothetical protein